MTILVGAKRLWHRGFRGGFRKSRDLGAGWRDRLWRSAAGDCVQELKGHSRIVRSVVFSHGSALVASASDDHTVRLWRSATGEYVRELQGHTLRVTSVAFSHDSALVASASYDHTVRLWRIDTGECV